FALYHKTKQLIRKTASGEHYTYFGFISLFLIFSFSSFQLSFYLNPLFPLLAILTTAALLGKGIRALKVFSLIHLVLCALLVIGVFLLQYFFAGSLPNADTLIILVAGTVLGFFLFTRKGIYL